MSDQQAFQKLKEFFETRPVCKVAADPLRKNVEIGIVINDALQCVFYKEDGIPRFDQRQAIKPDVVFYMSPDAVENLVSQNTEDVGELGVSIVKNYLAGSIKIKVPGSMMGLLTNGYLGVISTGGLSFTKFLASHGVNGLGKIKDVIQRMRKQD